MAKRLRIKVIGRDKHAWKRDRSGNCKICGVWRKILQRDRIIPVREGGTYVSSNVQWICANCHQDKTSLEQSAAHKGRPKPPEQLAKMSAWQKGKIYSEETKENIRQGNLRAYAQNPSLREYLSKKAIERHERDGSYWTGKKRSPETVAKIAASNKKRWEEKRRIKMEQISL